MNEASVPEPRQLEGFWELSGELLAVLGSTDGRFIAANPAWRAQIGMPPSELIGQRWPLLVHPDDRAATEQLLTELRRTGSAVQHEEIWLPTGDLGWRRMVWSAVRERSDRVLLTVVPRAASGRVEQELRELEQRFRLAMTYAPVGMAISRLDGPWLAVNPALCALLGRDEDTLLASAGFEELTHPDDLARELPLLEQLLAGTRSHYELEKRYLRPDGSQVWTQTVVSLVRDESGQPRYFVAQCLDTTRRREVEEQLRATAVRLEESDGIRVAFLRATSHELRTPLTVIAGMVETLLAQLGGLSEEQVLDMLERMWNQTMRLRQLVEDLLDVDRLSSGLALARLAPVPIGRIVREVLDGMELPEGRVRTDLAEAVVDADAPKLERVVANLVTNALRHGGADGVVLVQTRRERSDVVLTVEDEGTGIPDGLEQRIFEPFVQAPVRRTAANPGTGLGLTLARELVKLHDGVIGAWNRPGGGAVFEVRLPYSAEDPGASLT